MLSWMAWTWPTALVFIGIFSAIGVLILLEIRTPGGDARKGILGLTTTRGDRLFISLLGTSYIFLAWLGLVGMPLWTPLGLAIAWGIFCFWKLPLRAISASQIKGLRQLRPLQQGHRLSPSEK